MKVSIISLTKPYSAPTSKLKAMTCEELIIYTARVSSPSNQMNTETSDVLARYLIKNKHWSPFEMASMCVEIVTSRAIAQQILRHRSFSFQEFSQRYARVTEFEPVQLRYQAEKNRQSSVNPVSGDDYNYLMMQVENILDASDNLYKEMLERNVAKECARMILPLTTQTTLYMNGTIRSWIHYLQERTKPGVQLEHREIAQGVATIFEEEFPMITKALANE